MSCHLARLPVRGLVAAVALLSVGCGKQAPTPTPAPTPAPPADPATPPRSAAAADAAAPAAAAPTEIPWIHDDYAAARARAIEQGKPLVIDMWAPWCHTCLSMQETVMKRPEVVKLADRFVWLALDTDRAVNAAALDKYPVAAWPTFFVADAAADKVEARLVGSGTPAELVAFLERGAAGYSASHGGAPPADALALVREGDRAAAAEEWGAADAAYGRAVAGGGLGARLPDVLLAQLGVRYKAGDWKGCVELAEARLADAAKARSSKAADFAGYAMICIERGGDELAPEASERLMQAIAAKDSPVRAVLMDPHAPLTVDDRSDGLRILREVHDALGQREAGTELARQQRDLLVKAIDAAPNARVAMLYNWPYAEVSVRLGEPEQAIRRIERSARALPGEYDPAYRLAWVLLQAGKPDEALPWASKALELAYGPRKARVQGLVADLYAAKGEVRSEIDARKAVVAIYERLPPGQASPRGLEAAQRALAKAQRAADE